MFGSKNNIRESKGFIFLKEYDDDNVTDETRLENKRAIQAKQKEVSSDIEENPETQKIGGIDSYLKRNLPGLDGDEKIFKQVKTELGKVKTEGDKIALIRKIDDIIANTSGSGKITWTDIVTTLGLVAFAPAGLGIAYTFGKWAWGKSEKRQEFLDRMTSLKATVANYPVPKATQTKGSTDYDRNN